VLPETKNALRDACIACCGKCNQGRDGGISCAHTPPFTCALLELSQALLTLPADRLAKLERVSTRSVIMAHRRHLAKPVYDIVKTLIGT
jgi:hypothetical protein